jgi:hypothetical protein
MLIHTWDLISKYPETLTSAKGLVTLLATPRNIAISPDRESVVETPTAREYNAACRAARRSGRITADGLTKPLTSQVSQRIAVLWMPYHAAMLYLRKNSSELSKMILCCLRVCSG